MCDSELGVDIRGNRRWLIVQLRVLAKSVRRQLSSVFHASEALQLSFEGIDDTLAHCGTSQRQYFSFRR